LPSHFLNLSLFRLTLLVLTAISS